MQFDHYILHRYMPEFDGTGPELYAHWLEQVDLAEQLGYGCVWLTEHHFGPYGGMLPDPQLFLAALSQRTSRIRLGIAVILMPLHNPMRVAEDVAMLDVLSNGRVDVGVGRGMAVTRWDAFGADEATSQQRLDEHLDLLCQALSGEDVRWSGTFLRWETPVTVLPRPVQQPHPPIWVPATRHAELCREIGRRGYNLLTLPWYTPDFGVTRDIIQEYRAGQHEAGYPEGYGQIMAMYNTCVAETAEEAKAAAAPALNQYTDTDENIGSARSPLRDYDVWVAASRIIAGTPEMCRQHVQRIKDELGVDRIALRHQFGGQHRHQVLASLRLFAQEVAPAFAEEVRPSHRPDCLGVA